MPILTWLDIRSACESAIPRKAFSTTTPLGNVICEPFKAVKLKRPCTAGSNWLGKFKIFICVGSVVTTERAKSELTETTLTGMLPLGKLFLVHLQQSRFEIKLNYLVVLS